MSFALFVFFAAINNCLILGMTARASCPMASGFVELAMRVGAALLLPRLLGALGVYLAEIAAWIGAGVFLIIGCYRQLNHS